MTLQGKYKFKDIKKIFADNLKSDFKFEVLLDKDSRKDKKNKYQPN